MKVLLISNLFPTPAEAARGLFTEQLARRLHERCELTVVCPLPWVPRWTARGPLDRLHAVAAVPRGYHMGPFYVYSPKYSPLPSHPRMRVRSMFLGLAPTIFRLHRREHFDVINCHWLHPDGVAAAWIARCCNLPLVLTALGSDVNLLLDDERRQPAIVNALRSADAVIAKSSSLRARIAQEGIPAERIDVIRNGVDTTRFTIRDRDAAAGELGLPPGERRLLFVGKLTGIKGVCCLLEAFARVAASDDRTTLYLVGEGAERSAYERLAHDRGLHARVRFVGAEHPTRMPLWFGAADVLCLPSVHEGCPNVVLEALASGRPVVASRVGGVSELVPDIAGELVPPGDAAALAAALEGALMAQWDSVRIRAEALSRSWEKTADSYCAVYASALAARAALPARPAVGGLRASIDYLQ
jgi:teichuronic acid biosynthesis glycosyltransferase TuaC